MSALVLAAGLHFTAPANTDPIHALIWERRILVILAPATNDARAAETLRLLRARACEVADRDITIVLAPALGEGRIDDRPLARHQGGALRKRFHAGDEDFAVVLIGKDGGEKLRLAAPPLLDQVFALIDGMPMRRAEMRARRPACRGD